MFYAAELRFLKKSLRRCGLHVCCVNPDQPLILQLEQREALALLTVMDPKVKVYDYIAKIEGNTIYRMMDPFSCSYLFLQLPGIEPEQVLLIGPFMERELNRRQIMERLEKLELPGRSLKSVEREYRQIPVLPRGSQVFIMLDVFADFIWGGPDRYTQVDIDQDIGMLSPLLNRGETSELHRTLHEMKAIEELYGWENALMQAVSQGLTHKVELILNALTPSRFEQRLEDPVRNMKNYAIIMNTLLRKAAEQGGVHPIYLDSVSSDFARRIENQMSLASVHELMGDIYLAYCRLVKKHAIGRYSPLIQKAIACIDADLSAELSLKNLAALLNVNGSYLSTLFKQETGQTLTEYVQRKRIDMAKSLLKSTKLHVQTIAQSCGFLDIQYFTKVFKKYTGVTPKEFRTAADL